MTDIVFQILDILSRDELITSENEDTIVVSYDTVNNDYSDDENERSKMPKTQALRSQLLIHLFGRTVTGKRIRIDVEGFCPYFYIEAPILTTGQLRIAQQQLKDYLAKNCKFASHVTISLEFREKFYGFTNHMNFAFFKLTVKSMQHFYNLRQLFLNKENYPQIKGMQIGTLWGKTAPAVYESHLDPMLRFLHTQNIQPCGWITIKDIKECELVADEPIRCNYTDCMPASAPAAAAPFVTVSWDIECFSGSGDFPLAKKDYKKVAKDLYAVATSGAHAVELIDQAMLWLNEGDVLSEVAGRPITPIQCKNRLSPDARRVFLAGMNQEKIYNELEKYLKDSENNQGVGGRLASPLDKEEAIEGLTDSLNRILGTRFPVAGDPIIQIGASIAGGEKHIFVYPSCDPIEGAIVHVSPNEAAMLVDWFKWMESVDPDILLGYNIFGFDEKYVWQRVEELGLEDDLSLQAFNRLSADGGVMKCEESFLSSSALGDNVLNMWTTQGRLQIDLYHYVKRTMQLASYKLDDVAASLMSGALISIGELTPDGRIELTLKGAVKDIRVGRALKLLDESNEAISAKLEVISVAAGGKIVVQSPPMDDDEWIALKADAELWTIVKDDVSPADIFRFHCGSTADRAKVAKYCIQDCDLVIELYKKLETFMNAMAMANVCSVPVRFIFTRGQGIKIESLIAKECLELNKCIVTLPAPSRGSTEASYEGAIVLDPIPSFYNRSPIGVGDFASLYPSTIISENISHDTLVWVRDFDDDGYLIKHVWGSDVYDELEGVDYTDIKFDLLIPDPDDHRKTPQKIKAGNRICRYAQDSAGTMPIILKKLLAARKAKRNEAAKETDPLRAILLDTEQLAYKTTANSLYGQLGSGTFKMRLQDLAASTTAYGRLQIMFAKAVIEQFYGPATKDVSHFVGDEKKEVKCEAVIMYGDTDSLFIEFNPRDPKTGERLKGREAREAVIDLTTEAGHLVTHALKPPHDFEFDKVFDPMLMFSKKRYAGKMYESNPDDFVYKYMGIVLKRRDNAPIVKKIYGNAMKKVLDEGDVAGATKYVQDAALELVTGTTSLGLLTITKSLRAEYANPERIAHKVLADRMAIRDPGTAPAAGDRIGYVYVKPPPGQVAAKKQGDRIETPAYVKSTPGVELDAVYYIDHQIKVPVSQMFGLLLEQMPEYERSMLPSNYDECDMEHQMALRENVASNILFSPALNHASMLEKRRVMTKMFGLTAPSPSKDVNKPVRQKATATTPEPKKPMKQSRLTNYFENREILAVVKRMSKKGGGSGSDSSSAGSR